MANLSYQQKLRKLEECVREGNPTFQRTAFLIVRDTDDAEDVVQQALAKIAQHLDMYQDLGDPRGMYGFINKVIKNSAIDLLRLRRYHQRYCTSFDNVRLTTDPETGDGVDGYLIDLNPDNIDLVSQMSKVDVCSDGIMLRFYELGIITATGDVNPEELLRVVKQTLNPLQYGTFKVYLKNIHKEYKDMAQELGIKTGAMKQRVFRIRRKLSTALFEE